METKLQIMILIFAAGLLVAPLVSAAPLPKAAIVTTIAKPHFVGIASWYGSQHQGRKMANGQRFDRHKMTAAYWYLPLGSVIRVTNLENGRSITVTVTDRGPNFRLNRVLDLSEAAASELDYIQKGLTFVFVSPVVGYEPQHAALQATLVEPQNELFVSDSTAQQDVR
jgi:rare lipoprotein A (peptidoglycan hydrolase)